MDLFSEKYYTQSAKIVELSNKETEELRNSMFPISILDTNSVHIQYVNSHVTQCNKSDLENLLKPINIKLNLVSLTETEIIEELIEERKRYIGYYKSFKPNPTNSQFKVESYASIDILKWVGSDKITVMNQDCKYFNSQYLAVAKYLDIVLEDLKKLENIIPFHPELSYEILEESEKEADTTSRVKKIISFLNGLNYSKELIMPMEDYERLVSNITYLEFLTNPSESITLQLW